MGTLMLRREVGRAEVDATARMLVVALTSEQVGARIAQAREEMKPKRWSQLDLAIALDVSPASIYRWEKGRLPSVSELVRIAEVLGKPPDYLTEPPERQLELSEVLTAVQGLRELVELLRDDVQRGTQSALVSLESIDRRLSKLEARRAPRASGSSQA